MYTISVFTSFFPTGMMKECAWMMSLWCLLCRARVVIIYKHINLFYIIKRDDSLIILFSFMMLLLLLLLLLLW